MKKNVMRWTVPFAVIALGVLGSMGVTAVAKKDEANKAVDTRPVVQVETIEPADYQVVIQSYGELMPLETTNLAAQVSGKVTYWHEQFVSGGKVAKGDVLMRIEKDNYEAAVLQAEAELARAQAVLIEENAKAKVAEDEARRFPDKQHTDLFLRKPQVMSAEASVKSAQAGLQRARRDLENCEIIAPYDAIVVSRNVGLGQFVGTGTPLAVLNNIEAGEVEIPIAGFDSVFLPARISGLPAEVSNKGINSYTREAYVARDLGIVDSATRMSHLVVRVDDPYGFKSGQSAVKFGTFLNVAFKGATLKQIFKLPQDLVNNQTVWVMNDEGKLEPRKVRVIREEGGFFLVAEGIERTDKVVMTLPEYPTKGLAVRVAGAKDPSDSSDVTKSEKL
ncbi:Membrane fusion protein of RND family multidrug efflux pump [Pseudoalteromonas luteoviolacea B = ATCC 29581]|nr:Membrane fusion protein of RND family multidrug efflux pump [Pseudoalteromonas luteoviolacea B = ATCC 29581]